MRVTQGVILSLPLCVKLSVSVPHDRNEPLIHRVAEPLAFFLHLAEYPVGAGDRSFAVCGGTGQGTRFPLLCAAGFFTFFARCRAFASASSLRVAATSPCC